MEQLLRLAQPLLLMAMLLRREHKDGHAAFSGDVADWAAAATVLGVGSLANSAGVGGGAIYIPILQALVGFALKDATAVSQALIAAGSVVSVLINVFKRHPLLPSQPLINFQLALAFTPVLLVGVAVGVLLNTIFPAWLITILLLVLMTVMVFQSSGKARRLWRAESKAAAAERAAAQAARREQVLEHLSQSPDLGDTSKAPMPLGMKVSHRSSLQHEGHYHSLPAYTDLPASVTWQGGALGPLAGWHGVKQLPDDAMQSLASLEGASDGSAVYNQFAAPARASQRRPQQTVQAEDRWLSYGSMEGQEYPEGTTGFVAGQQDVREQQRAVQPSGLRIASAPVSHQAGQIGWGVQGSPASEQMRTPLLDPAEVQWSSPERSSRSRGLLSRGVGSSSARLSSSVGYDRLNNFMAGNAWERHGSGTLASIAEHGTAAGDRYGARPVPVNKGEQSWLTRRSRWRSLMLQDLTGEMGSVAHEQSLFARAQSLHFTEQGLPTSLQPAVTAPSAAAPRIRLSAEARSQPVMHANAARPLQDQADLGIVTLGAAAPSTAASSTGGLGAGEAVQGQKEQGSDKQLQFLEELLSAPRVSSRMPPVLPPLDKADVADILSHAGEKSVPRLGRPRAVLATLQQAVDRARQREAAASANTQPQAGAPAGKQQTATPFAAAAGDIPVDRQLSDDQNVGVPVRVAEHVVVTSPRASPRASLGFAPPTRPSPTRKSSGLLRSQLAATASPHLDLGTASPHGNWPDYSSTPVAARAEIQGQAPVVASLFDLPQPHTPQGPVTGAEAQSPSERLLRASPVRMHATFLRARSLSSSNLERLSRQHLSSDLISDQEAQPQHRHIRKVLSAGNVARLPLTTAQLAVNVIRVMASDLSNLPWRLIAGMATLWVVFCSLQVARSLVVKCSPVYWALLAVQLTLMLSFSAALTLHTRRQMRRNTVTTGTGDYKAVTDEEAGTMVIADGRAACAQKVPPDPRAWQKVAEPAPAVPNSASDAATDGHIVLVCDGNGDSKDAPSKRIPAAKAPRAVPPAATIHAKGNVPPSTIPGTADTKAANTDTSGPSAFAGASLGVLAIAGLAGLVGGLLGLGGGMLIGPLLLEIGTHPQVGAATSSLMVLFSSSAALVGFVVLNRLNVQYSLVLGAASAGASILGVLIVSDLVRRTGRTSIVVFMLSGFMLLALAAIAGFGITNMIDQFKSGDAVHFNSICS